MIMLSNYKRPLLTNFKFIRRAKTNEKTHLVDCFVFVAFSH